MKSTKLIKELKSIDKDFKAICRNTESIRTEIVKTHDCILEKHWNKLFTQDAYNLGLIGNIFICKQFPNDFDIRILLQCHKEITEMKERLEKELD